MNGLYRWLVVILLIGSLSYAIVQVTKYKKYKIFLYASQANIAGNYDVSEAYFRQVYKTLKYESYFSLMFAECLFENKKYGEALDVLNNVKK